MYSQNAYVVKVGIDQVSIPDKKLKELLDSIQSPNIAVIGRTGAGKSTLINAVFGSELAKTGTGLPVSDGFYEYPDTETVKDSPVVLYDSAGYEMSKESFFKRSVFEFIEQKIAEGVEKQIHLVWYVIHTPLKRFEYFDADIVRQLNQRRIPTIIVLSQIDIVRPNEIALMRQQIENFDLSQLAIVEVAAYPMQGKPKGVEDLVYRTSALLPEIYSDAFIMRQTADIKLKRKTAWKYISVAALACFSSGYVPIPFTTALAVASSQGSLYLAISRLYGYTKFSSVLEIAATGTGAALMTEVVTTVFDFISFVFPPGWIISGSLSATAAATFIVIAGISVTVTVEKAAIEYADSEESEENIKRFLRETFKEEFNRYKDRINVQSKGDLVNIGEKFIKS